MVRSKTNKMLNVGQSNIPRFTFKRSSYIVRLLLLPALLYHYLRNDPIIIGIGAPEDECNYIYTMVNRLFSVDCDRCILTNVTSKYKPPSLHTNIYALPSLLYHYFHIKGAAMLNIKIGDNKGIVNVMYLDKDQRLWLYNIKGLHVFTNCSMQGDQ